MNKSLYIISGPTAVGKTAVAIALAQLLGTEIISADSRQCYREMNIGVARPSPQELGDVKHYFINMLPVTQSFSAADFEQLALQYLDEIFTTHDTAIVCGGSGLYIKALCEGLDEMPEINAVLATEIEAEFKNRGLEWLQQAVAEEDPVFYLHGEIHNPARLLRALTFIRSTGKSITEFRSQTRKNRPFQIHKIGLDLPRTQLYERINKRVDQMMDQGLLEEVASLTSYRQLKTLQTVGYAELFEYLEGNCTLPQAVNLIKQHTRNYAKRQLTWFRKDQEITWFAADDKDVAKKIAGLHK